MVHNRLTPAQKSHFLGHGWLRIPGGIPPENVQVYLSNIWIRLGYDPNDKSTWVEEKVHTPRHRQMPIKEFAPKAWEAICEYVFAIARRTGSGADGDFYDKGEILGGEDRIDMSNPPTAGDSLICNFGTDEWVDVS